MRRARAGLSLLTIWCALNALVAVGVTAMTLAGRSPPALALVMTKDEAKAIEPRSSGGHRKPAPRFRLWSSGLRYLEGKGGRSERGEDVESTASPTATQGGDP